MSDALISSLNVRITELTNELATVKAEARDRRKKAGAQKTELETAQAELTRLTKERDDWKTKATGTPGELQTKIDSLTAEIRDRDHRDAFKELYGDAELGLNKSVSVDDLWKLIDYKPEGDKPDPAKIKAQLEGFKTSKPILFGQQGGETPQDAPGGAQGLGKQLLEAAAGSGRGAPDKAARRFVVNAAQRQDPDWMSRNQEAIAKASAEGNLVFG